MTMTPHKPENVAKVAFKSPQTSSVCQRSSPNKIPAILQAARLTEAMIMQLKKKPRYTERKPRTTLAAFPE